jgi:F420-dependent oxidoreductase-like protein
VIPAQWEEMPVDLGGRLGEMVRLSEQAGIESLWATDHLMATFPPYERPVPEAYTLLSYMAAHSQRAKLGVMVSAVTFRYPSILVKQVTTLDVLTQGRAWLGIGAAWFDAEHEALGVPFPSIRERQERLEEAVQIALQMWGDDDGPFAGKHYQLDSTLNLPQCVSKPHPPIMIGGSGERTTLCLVARYANACNFFMAGPATVRQKLDVLREHCQATGRNYDDIERTVGIPVDVGPSGTEVNRAVDLLGEYAEIGVQTVIAAITDAENLWPLEVVGEKLVPAVAAL